MNLKIATTSDDDPEFVNGLTRLTLSVVQQYQLDELFLIRTDNWFDVKWLGFAGTTKIGFPTAIPFTNSQVNPSWKGGANVTIPPFVPHRIIDETHLKYHNGALVDMADESRRVHPTETMRSVKNLTNRVLDHSPSGLFIWFSSKSASNGRASVMIYRTFSEKVGGWYVSFVRSKEWRIDKVRNNDRQTVEKFFASS